MRPYLFFLVIFCLVLSSYRGVAGEPLVLTGEDKDIFLTKKYLEILDDPEGRLGIEEVSSSKFSTLFKPLSTEYPTNPVLNGAYWLRLHLKAEENLSEQYLLESFTFKVNQLELYYPDQNGNYKSYKTGNQYIFEDRGLSHKNFEFLLPLTKNQEKIIYIKYQTADPVRLVMVIRNFERFTQYALSEYFLLGLFYGIILVIAVYNLFLFYTIRERAYLYYVLYVVSIGFYAMAQDGTGFQYIWPDFPEFNNYCIPIFMYSLVLWITMYTRKFLPVKEKAPMLNQMVIYYLVFRTSYFILSITYFPILKVFMLIDLIPFLLCYLIAFSIYRQGVKSAIYFIAGFSFLFIAFLINGLMYAKLLESSIFTVYSMNMGAVAEMILLSIALAERVRQFREEKAVKEQENTRLELMVAERTKALEFANTKLKVQATEIAQMNILLSEDNKKLEENVKKISEDRVMKNELDFEGFSKIYPDEESCFRFLSDLKWEKGYRCLRCNNITASSGKTIFSKRCSKCGYDESASAYTIFHSLKFPITKAFYMVFLVTENPNITVEELSEKLGLTVKTCWNFKKKISEAMVNQKGRKGKKKGSWTSIILQSTKSLENR